VLVEVIANRHEEPLGLTCEFSGAALFAASAGMKS
jgi:hypothetical protein